MKEKSAEYQKLVSEIVNELLPVDLSRKILSRSRLSRDEAMRVATVFKLAIRAKRLTANAEMEDHLAEIRKSLGALSGKTKAVADMEKLILYHVSGNDPKYKPKDGRKVSVVREMMVQEGLAALAKNAALTSRGVAANLIAKYSDLPGAYTDIDALRKQLDRKNPLV